MTLRGRRRLRNLALTVAAAGVLLGFDRIQTLSLRHASFTSGWLLLGLMLFLTAYNARKKLPFLPLGRSATWLQLHIWLGFLSVGLFVMHAAYRWEGGFHLPNGGFELTLASVYAVIAVSGVAGILLTRAIPPQLTVRGEQVLFERIPLFRRQLRDGSRELALRAASESNATTVADYYARRLAPFFATNRNFWHHLVQSPRPRQMLLAEIAALDRYLSDDERNVAHELAEMTEAKDDLDYQYALQLVLKGWLFFHLTLVYGLLVLVAVHVGLVYAFSGAAG